MLFRSYQWDSNETLSNIGLSNPVANPTVTTAYTVTVTDSKTCYATASTTVSVNSLPTVRAGNDVELCEGKTSVIGGVPTASGASPFVYQWTGGTLVNSSVANPTTSTNVSTIYTVSVTDNNGCTNTDKVFVEITPKPIVTAATSLEICSSEGSVQLSGAFSDNGSVSWSTGGDGSFDNRLTDNPIYTFGTNDKLGGVVNLSITVNGLGSCEPVMDVTQITITPAPIANAGGDWSQCSDNRQYEIFGASYANGSFEWGTSGDGSFDNEFLLAPTYNISDADTSNGSVDLIITVTGLGSCAAITDMLTLSLTPIPIVSAGDDMTACADNPTFNLSGTVHHATGLFWQTDGDGTIVNPLSLSPTYNAGVGDISLGSVTLTATSTGDGDCISVVDEIVLSITPAPTIFAGNDSIVCPLFDPIPLNGIVTASTGGEWSIVTGDGTIATTTALTTTYTPTQNDIDAGIIELQLTSTGNGYCIPVTDNIIFTFAPLPIVDPGNDTIVCFDATAIDLQGEIQNVGGFWNSPSGNGSFSPNNTTLNGEYLLTSDDKQLGEFYLVLTSTEGCIEVKDSIKVNVAAFVNAGIDTIVCSGTTSLELEGILSNPVPFAWSTSGEIGRAHV